MIRIFFIFLILNFLTACQSVKDGLTLKKKPASDEFLVQKKSPLVLPPNFGELPLPGENKSINEVDDQNDISVSLGQDELKINKVIKNSSPTNLEKSILKKIK